MRVLSRLTLNQKLGAVAVGLGLLAIWATPYAGSTVTLDTRELALEVAREADHVAPLDLADWIIKGRSDYRLVDIRSERAYAEYHIPTAEHVPLAGLLDADFGRQERIVLYSDGGIHAAQAWMLLRAKGHRAVYMLSGGLAEWQDQVLFPTLAENQTPFQAARNERLKAISGRFGGTPQAGGAAVAAGPVTRVLPKVEAPPPPVGGATRPARKKKEGC